MGLSLRIRKKLLSRWFFLGSEAVDYFLLKKIRQISNVICEYALMKLLVYIRQKHCTISVSSPSKWAKLRKKLNGRLGITVFFMLLYILKEFCIMYLVCTRVCRVDMISTNRSILMFNFSFVAKILWIFVYFNVACSCRQPHKPVIFCCLVKMIMEVVVKFVYYKKSSSTFW